MTIVNMRLSIARSVMFVTAPSVGRNGRKNMVILGGLITPLRLQDNTKFKTVLQQQWLVAINRR